MADTVHHALLLSAAFQMLALTFTKSWAQRYQLGPGRLASGEGDGALD